MAQYPPENVWKEYLKEKFADKFKEARALEVGSAAINGGNNGVFPVREYIGLDVQPYAGVNVVSVAHKYDAPDSSFDVVFSFSELEHDKYYVKTLRKMVKLLKPGGLMFFACCSTGWEEHGTKQVSPEQSLTSQLNEEWGNYYKNLTVADIKKVLDLEKIFSEYCLEIDPRTGIDLHFWGIKR